MDADGRVDVAAVVQANVRPPQGIEVPPDEPKPSTNIFVLIPGDKNVK